MTEESALQIAIAHYQKGDTEIALEKMQALLIAEPKNPDVRIEFANILMREKRFDDARDILNSLSADDKKNPTAQILSDQLNSIETVVNAPDIDELLSKISQNPKDCLIRQQLSAHYKLRGDYKSAMDQLLEIVRYDRTFNEDAGRHELLNIFESLGQEHELVGLYRRKLAQLLN